VAAMGAAQHYTRVSGAAHWASIKQASALVREGDTHPLRKREKKEQAVLLTWYAPDCGAISSELNGFTLTMLHPQLGH